MKNLIKFKVIILVFSIISTSQSIAADLILPKPKPEIDQETKIKTAKKKEIYPQKKPDKEKEEIESAEKTQEEVFIYPKKKPIIFQKKVDKAAAKSTILSRSDFKIAKASFAAVKKKKWKTAIKLSKKAIKKN